MLLLSDGRIQVPFQAYRYIAFGLLIGPLNVGGPWFTEGMTALADATIEQVDGGKAQPEKH